MKFSPKPVSSAFQLALDMDDGRAKAVILRVPDPDHLCFDARRRSLYDIGGAGRVTVIDAVSFSGLQKPKDSIRCADGASGTWNAVPCTWLRQPQPSVGARLHVSLVA